MWRGGGRGGVNQASGQVEHIRADQHTEREVDAQQATYVQQLRAHTKSRHIRFTQDLSNVCKQQRPNLERSGQLVRRVCSRVS